MRVKQRSTRGANLCIVMATGEIFMRIGVYVFGIASATFGVLNLIWGEFEPGHQPLQAWSANACNLTVAGVAWIAAARLGNRQKTAESKV